MKNNIILIMLTGLLFCCTGCRTSADFNYIEDSIRDQIYPARLDEDIKFSLGSLSMRMISGFIDDEEEADAFLKEIKSVQVAVYKVRDMGKTRSFQIPSDVERNMVKKGWDPFVHVRKRNGENVSLYYRQLSENTASIYAIVMEPDEVVITEINGKLDNILEKAICEHRLAGVNNL